MKTALTLLMLISCWFSALQATAQSRWVEQWITTGDGEPQLLEASLEDSLKNKVEKRIYLPNVTNREDWVNVFILEYDSTTPKKSVVYSKQVENGKLPSMVIAESYNDHSKHIKTTAYAGTDTLHPKVTVAYQYDASSNLIAEITTGYSEGVQTRHYRYKGKLVTEDWVTAGDSSISEHYTYQYNAAGKVIEKKLQIEADILAKQLFTWKYDDSGKIIEENIYLSDGSLYRKHTFSYDKNGDLSEVLEYGDESNTLISKITYKYLPVK